MLAEDSLRAGKPEEALAQLQDQVRKDPNNPKYRVFLFQLLSVLGRWDRALVQLKVAGDLDPSCQAMVQTYREALRCEVLRSHVFAGRKTPTFFGEPEEWMAFLIEALSLESKDKLAEAQAMRERALEAAPATSGTIDGQPFEWIGDGDTRLGPMLEAIINGRYCWLPFHRMRALRIEPPADLRDLVWMPCWITLTTGAEIASLVPTRYPGSENSSDPRILMARATDWTERAGGYAGLGQRQLVTDSGEFALLDIRLVGLNSKLEAPATAETPPASADG